MPYADVIQAVIRVIRAKAGELARVNTGKLIVREEAQLQSLLFPEPNSSAWFVFRTRIADERGPSRAANVGTGQVRRTHQVTIEAFRAWDGSSEEEERFQGMAEEVLREITLAITADNTALFITDTSVDLDAGIFFDRTFLKATYNLTVAEKPEAVSYT